jgi:hypothetical protein
VLPLADPVRGAEINNWGHELIWFRSAEIDNWGNELIWFRSAEIDNWTGLGCY